MKVLQNQVLVGTYLVAQQLLTLRQLMSSEMLNLLDMLVLHTISSTVNYLL